MQTYENPQEGYCFAYPLDRFTLEESTDGLQNPVIYGPALEQSADPVRARFSVRSQPIPPNSDLTRLVNEFLGQNQYQDLPSEITRSAVTVGGESAEALDDVPGRLSSRLVMAVHGQTFYTLSFFPSGFDLAEPDLTALYEAVISSFAFIDNPAPQLATEPQEVRWPEFDQVISLTYDPVLALWTEVSTVEAVPVKPEIMWAESHPAYVQIRFYGFNGGKEYQLPFLPLENRFAQVMVFQTSDFADLGEDFPGNYSDQRQALAGILQNGLEPGFCDQPLVSENEPRSLPFLPYINIVQTFCAQPQVIEFEGGQGIRYLTYYSSGLSPILDSQVFYTFQGLTDDGKFYVSAALPVATGIFPLELPSEVIDPDTDYPQQWLATITEQVSQLNADPGDGYNPSLQSLDALIESIRIE